MYRDYKEDEGIGCQMGIKFLLISINSLFMVCGCTMLGVSVWMLLERNFMSAIYNTELMTVSIYLLIIAGGIVFLISFIGCYGAYTGRRPFLIFYVALLITISVALIVGGALAFVMRTQINDSVWQFMRSTIYEDYGVDLESSYNRLMTDSWDTAQDYLRCCSVEDRSWRVYRDSEWYKIQPSDINGIKPLVPTSCCTTTRGEHINVQKCQTFQYGPPNMEIGGLENEALYSRGCYTAGKDFVEEYSEYIIGMGLGFGVCLFLGIIFALILLWR